MPLGTFLSSLTTNLPLLVTTLLTLGVVLVNGWTDAPNAIATCVSTRAMGVRPAILLAAVMDFLGILVMTALNAEVAQTIYHIADFGENPRKALVALCAAMTAIVLWAAAAWYFGIPTSESHALVAGISGAAVALNGGFAGIRWQAWVKVLYGLGLSTCLGFFLGFVTVKAVERLFRSAGRRRVNQIFRRAQVLGAGAMAFMHGAQDGQKFMGVFLLGLSLAGGNARAASFAVPVWLMLLCCVVMALGTSIGGVRIIKSVGLDMVRLEGHQGFAADLAAALCLLLSSLTGMPVSTTHNKTTAIMGVGAARRLSGVNWRVAREMALAWALTFPGCGLIGWAMARFFLSVFRS